jgi:hypothetical protein
VANLPTSARLHANALRALRNPTANVAAEGIETLQTSVDTLQGNMAPLLAASQASAAAASSSTTAYGPCPATDVTGAQFIANPSGGDVLQYVLANPGIYFWSPYELDWLQPANDRNYWLSFVTMQKGHVDATSGAWVPAADVDGRDEAPGVYYGQKIADSGAANSTASGQASLVQWKANPIISGWKVPPANNPDGSTNLDITFRFWIWCVSLSAQQALGSVGSVTLQSACWPSGADHFDLNPIAPANALDLSQANPTTLGPGITVTDNGLQVAGGVGITFDNQGNVMVKTASGVAVDGNGNVTVAAGNGIGISGGQVVVSAASGLAVGPQGVYVPLGGVVDAMIAGVGAAKVTAGVLAAGVVYAGTVAANQVLTGTLGAGVIYAGTINASQVNTGVLGAGVIYSGQINCSQLKAGTIAVGISLSSPIITGGSLYISAGSWRVQIDPLNGNPIQMSDGAGNGTNLGIDQVYMYGAGGNLTLSTLNFASLQMSDGFGSSSVKTTGISTSGSLSGASLAVTGNISGGGVSTLGTMQAGGYTGGAFAGSGVNCPLYGVAAAGFNPYVSGVQYFGHSDDLTIRDSLGNYCTINGSAMRLSFRGGAYVGLI